MQTIARSANIARGVSISLALLILLGLGYVSFYKFLTPASTLAAYAEAGAPRAATNAPELEGGVAWLNTGKPIKIADLKGKIVLLDFWTLCCINCIHTLPDLAKLEKKYANELVVIGVHSAKFENEKNSESIRKALLRYEIKHPVVNDANMQIWKAYDVHSWPTLVLIDPEGKLIATGSGEGLYDAVDKKVAELIKIHKENKTLNEKPMRFDTAAFRDKIDSPLYFPGKILVDAPSKRIFISDSTNHRVVITDLNGQKIAIAGTGTPGLKDGTFAEAQFDDPQGLALKGDKLYVADRRNHCIRELDLKAQTVKIIAGTGQQDRDRAEGGPALKHGLNSPWDLLIRDNILFIAMAGHHQIWALDLDKMVLDNYAGDGRENIKDGLLSQARFAQPSGLASDGKDLFVADCEVSAVRRVPLVANGRVETLVGTGLFDFGDQDGQGKEALLQHAIGLAYADGKVYVADTYNSKIKTIDLASGKVSTFVGGKGSGDFNEPCGLSIAEGNLYVADTNAHRIRIVDLKTKAIKTLELKGVEPVKVSSK
ncbi:redoxin domain-containing protein [Telmatocola sphagniphila]|uniref:Redoxin domain-containing protein n=1 Tax=Telmatocola sphagniphila TaxID=1123043 RepID=A0A8E6B612_9BACT|nr:thioredoxin-like domain-containing protein [Telmatocola sphagniphila]QVL31806.1 redoxin domain-containing protein [Telmatocola sphagniphila]